LLCYISFVNLNFKWYFHCKYFLAKTSHLKNIYCLKKIWQRWGLFFLIFLCPSCSAKLINTTTTYSLYKFQIIMHFIIYNYALYLINKDKLKHFHNLFRTKKNIFIRQSVLYNIFQAMLLKEINFFLFYCIILRFCDFNLVKNTQTMQFLSECWVVTTPNRGGVLSVLHPHQVRTSLVWRHSFFVFARDLYII